MDYKVFRRVFMKKNVWNGAALLLAALAVLALAGCPQEGSLNSDASISAVKVAGIPALSLGTPSMDWTQAVEKRGHIYIDGVSLTNANVEVSAASGSTVFLARAQADVVPEFVKENKFNFGAEDFLFVEVFSENLDKYTIYAIQIHNRTPGLVDFTLAGRSAAGGTSASGRPIQSFGKVGSPVASLEELSAEKEGEIAFSVDDEGNAISLTITPEVANYSARVTTAAATGTPVFGGAWAGAGDNGVISGISITPKDGDYLFIQLKSDGGSFSDITYYKIKLIAKESNRALQSVNFVWYEGATEMGRQTMAIGTMGTSSFPGDEAYGTYTNGVSVPAGNGIYTITSYTSAATIPGNYKLVVEAVGKDPGLNIKYGVTKNLRDGGISFPNETGDLGRLVGSWFIGLEVTSGIGQKGWYAFQLNSGRPSLALDDIKINGVSIKSQNSDALPAGNALVDGTNTGVYRVQNKSDLDSIKIQAVPPAGYENRLHYALGAEIGSSVSNTSFIVNDENKVDTFTGFVSGQYVIIQVVAESATLSYGASGGDANWTAMSFYKVQILYGDSDPTINDITVNNTSVGDFSAAGPQNAANLAGALAKTLTAAELATFKINAVPANANAQISYAVTTAANTAPAEPDYNTTGEFPNLPSNRYIVIRVKPEDGSLTQYYKFHIKNDGSSSTAITNIKVNGTDISPGAANSLTVGTDWKGNATYSMGTASVNANVSSLATVTVQAEGFDPGTAIAYVMSTANEMSTAPDADSYQISGEFTNFPVASWVFIRVTAADNSDTKYYKARILLSGANTAADITKVTIAGVDIPMLPSANTAANGTTGIVNYLVPGSNVTVLNNLTAAAEATPGALVGYAMVAASDESPLAWSADTLFPTWQNAHYLYIRVISQDGLTTRYYKVRIFWGDSSAALTDIKFNGVSITTEGGIPAPNTDVNTGTTAGVFHPDDMDSIAVTVIAPDTASVSYALMENVQPSSTNDGKGNITYSPVPWSTTASFRRVTLGYYVYIRVASQDTSVTNYYKIKLVSGNSSTALTGITVNSTAISTLPAANAAVTGTTAETYTSAAFLSPVTVAASQAAGNGAVISYAVAAAASANVDAANFTAANSFTGFTSGQYVVIRVVSQDGANTAYYKVQVIHGSAEAELEGIRVNNNYVVPPPQANTAVTGTNAETATLTGAADLATVTVRVGVSPGAGAAFGTAETVNGNVTNFTNTTGVFSNFIRDEYVVIRVTSQNGQVIKYYKVQVAHP
jgi:hypothetical protein